MKRLICTLITFAACFQLHAQLSLDDCYTRAEQNYPLTRQRDLLTKSEQYGMENAAKGFYPQLSINGQATYQSEVTQVPIRVPGNEIPTISKDQYKIYAELTQTIYDGGATRNQKQMVSANAKLETDKLDVELYKIYERVNQLYFGILMVDEQLHQTIITRKDIDAGIQNTNAALANGTALKSSGDVLQAEALKLDQRKTELKSLRHAYLDMLGLFLNTTIPDSVSLDKPSQLVREEKITRPELLMFDQQQAILKTQNNTINVKNRPRLAFFFQGGFGRPALNFLNNDLKSYYLGGLRLSWSLTGLYTKANEKKIIETNHEIVNIQRDMFLFNTNLVSKQQQAEIQKFQDLLQTDRDIVVLRTRIKETALIQLENGVITTNDYMREVNAEDMAKQNLSLHELQLLLAQYNQRTTLGMP